MPPGILATHRYRKLPAPVVRRGAPVSGCEVEHNEITTQHVEPGRSDGVQQLASRRSSRDNPLLQPLTKIRPHALGKQIPQFLKSGHIHSTESDGIRHYCKQGLSNRKAYIKSEASMPIRYSPPTASHCFRQEQGYRYLGEMWARLASVPPGMPNLATEWHREGRRASQTCFHPGLPTQPAIF